MKTIFCDSLSDWAPVCCLFFLRFVSSRAGSLIFSLSSYLSMHCVLIMPPAWAQVLSSDAGKSLPCRTFPLVQPLGCPSLVAGLSPCAGPGKEPSLCTAPAAFLGMSREHGKRDWGLMLTAGLWKCSWQWLLFLFSALTYTSALLPNLFLPSVWSPSKSSFRMICLYSHSTSISLQRCLEQTASPVLQLMNSPTIWFKCSY